MSACIYYHPEAYTTSGPKLMGRNAAGESFLKGFFRYSKTSEFWVQVQKIEHARHFAGSAIHFGRSEPVRAVEGSSLSALKEPGVVYYPGPGISEHAFHRSFFDHHAWSLCGITHTTSSARAMDAIVGLLTAPVQPWDALICTSVAVKKNVEVLLQAQVDFLKERLGITRIVLPQMPVIPLGVHTSDFVFSEDQKASARNRLGLGIGALSVLFMGRLSFHAKAHPLAMYQALEKAARITGKEVVLIECGWHANEFIKKAYEEAAQLSCPSVRVVTLDGRKPEDREAAWASADIFCSLSDNIQETFGIVPVEAMAAGLPLVVSDWDGYRDTVRKDVDGFCIPTLMPGAGLGGDLAFRHALEIDTYDMYCGQTCSLVAVNVEMAAEAFARLFQFPELRWKMGQAGRQRACELYDWSVIIPRYEALWAELNEMRKAQAITKISPVHPWPARPDPFQVFSRYPTHLLTSQTLIGFADQDHLAAEQRTAVYRQLAMVKFADAVLPTPKEVQTVFQAIFTSGPRPALELVAEIPKERQAFVLRSLTWLVKLGILKVFS